MPPDLRIARPVRDLDLAVSLYREGLGFQELGGFRDHDGGQRAPGPADHPLGAVPKTWAVSARLPALQYYGICQT